MSDKLADIRKKPTNKPNKQNRLRSVYDDKNKRDENRRRPAAKNSIFLLNLIQARKVSTKIEKNRLDSQF